MSEKPTRGKDGRFPRGVSGNPKGRPTRNRQIPSAKDVRDMLYDVAEFPVSVKIDGKSLKVPLIVANALTLGAKGAAGDVLGARSFMATLRLAVEQEQRNSSELAKRFEDSEPAYLREIDPKRRAAFKRGWDDLQAEIGGKRQRRSQPFPPAKRKPRKGV